MPDILIVDDDAGCAEAVSLMLKQQGHGAWMVGSAKAALAQLEKRAFDLIITDVRMDGMNGLELLRVLKTTVPEVPVVLVTAHEDTRTGVEAMRIGAADFLMKPLRLKDVAGVVDKALGVSRVAREAPPPAPLSKSGLIGDAPRLRTAREELAKVAPSHLRVLLTGEPGTGKELAARDLHARSPRAKEPFIAVNCAAIPDTLFEAELFGTVSTAHSTARDRPGRVELAEGGTLFLDEVGELTPAAQAKLLRLLEEGEFERLGDPHTRKADVRVVSATNRPLEQMKREGKFRPDLFDRLNGVTISLPSLREHPEDLRQLVSHFVPEAKLGDGALALLQQYSWPGNVRELRNFLERLLVFSDDRSNLTEADVRRELARNIGQTAAPAPSGARTVDDAMIRDALARTSNNKAQAARLLGISRRTLYYRLDAMPP